MKVDATSVEETPPNIAYSPYVIPRSFFLLPLTIYSTLHLFTKTVLLLAIWKLEKIRLVRNKNKRTYYGLIPLCNTGGDECSRGVGHIVIKAPTEWLLKTSWKETDPSFETPSSFVCLFVFAVWWCGRFCCHQQGNTHAASSLCGSYVTLGWRTRDSSILHQKTTSLAIITEFSVW